MTTRPTAPEVRLSHLNGHDVASGNYDKAILPLGALEYHGPAFPYSTDAIAAETIAEAIARELGDTLVLPALDYGVSHHHLPWPWTISLRPETLAAIVRDVAESLLHHGITKLLIVSTHDGNPEPATVAARGLSQDHGMAVAIFSGWQGKAAKALAPDWDIDEDHAGQAELSMVLYGAPELAAMEHATHEQNQFMDLPIDLIDTFDGTVPKGYSGNAAAATAAEGEAIVGALTALVVPFLRKLDEQGWKRGTWMSRIDR